MLSRIANRVTTTKKNEGFVKYEWIKRELAKDDIRLTTQGIENILAGRQSAAMADEVVARVLDLHSKTPID